MMRTLGQLIEPLTGRCWSPAEAVVRTQSRIARYVALGLRPRDRVFLHYGNSLEFFVDLLAIWQLGACAVPVDSRLTGFEITQLATAARPRFAVWETPPEPALEQAMVEIGVISILQPDSKLPGEAGAPPAPGIRLDDEALILFTSGTTGDPKGVVHTHRSLRARWDSLAMALGRDAYRRTLCLLPTHFGHGLICNCLFPWLSGQDLFVMPPFRADILMRLGELIDTHRITFLSSVPTVWRLATRTSPPPRQGSLLRISCGSAPLSGALWQSVRDWSGTQQVINAYGITETASWLAGTTVPFETPEDGLIGTTWGGTIRILKASDTSVSPVWLDECGVDEPGHVWVSTPALMKGYLDRDDLTDKVVADGWFCTGDVGAFDERGYLYLRGRERDEINKGGAKVYPSDIDAVVERFPGVLDSCTFAIEDPLLGEDVGIAVVLDAASSDVLARLHDWAGAHLAAHQMPRRWYVVPEIPRTSRGKVNRARVAEHCAREQPVRFAGRTERDSSPGRQP